VNKNSSVIIGFEILLWLSGNGSFSGPSRNGPQNSHLPVSQSIPVNPAGHKHWKVCGVKERQIAFFGHGLDEQRFYIEKKYL